MTRHETITIPWYSHVFLMIHHVSSCLFFMTYRCSCGLLPQFFDGKKLGLQFLEACLVPILGRKTRGEAVGGLLDGHDSCHIAAYRWGKSTSPQTDFFLMGTEKVGDLEDEWRWLSFSNVVNLRDFQALMWLVEGDISWECDRQVWMLMASECQKSELFHILFCLKNWRPLFSWKSGLHVCLKLSEELHLANWENILIDSYVH